MGKPTDRNATGYTPEQVDELIGQAELATGILPPVEHCGELREQLRAAIGQLAGEVRQQQETLPDNSPAWYRCDRLLARTDDLLKDRLPTASLAAALHVAALGRLARELTDCGPKGES